MQNIPTRNNPYATITEAIIAAIERDPGKPQLPWRRQGSSLAMPRNALTDNTYKGINVLSLWSANCLAGYESSTWASYRQWLRLGAQVRKGEKGTMVIFYGEYTDDQHRDQSENSDPPRRVARATVVFNAAQVDGYAPDLPILDDPQTPPCSPIPAVEAVIAATGADIRHGGARAFYNRCHDFIQMPDRDLFIGKTTSGALESYYAVLCHELAHWTGAASRLDRRFGQKFGDDAYAREELVAELAAAFMCAELGVTNEPRADTHNISITG